MSSSGLGAAAFAMLRAQKGKPYLFVDGNCLRAEINAFVRRVFGIQHLSDAWSVPQLSTFEKTFFYDALPSRPEAERDPAFEEKLQQRRAELARIGSLPNTHVRTGHTQTRSGREKRLEQKGVDIQLAVDALSLASRGAFREITILTGDLDFRPLLDELVMMGLTVELWHPKIVNEELVQAADRRRLLSAGDLIGVFSSDFHRLNTFPEQAGLAAENFPDIHTVEYSWTDIERGDCAIGRYRDSWRLSVRGLPGHGGQVFTHPERSVLEAFVAEIWDLRVPTSTAG